MAQQVPAQKLTRNSYRGYQKARRAATGVNVQERDMSMALWRIFGFCAEIGYQLDHEKLYVRITPTLVRPQYSTSEHAAQN
eukprot:1290469-Rhodomonas_salina.1